MIIPLSSLFLLLLEISYVVFPLYQVSAFLCKDHDISLKDLESKDCILVRNRELGEYRETCVK